MIAKTRITFLRLFIFIWLTVRVTVFNFAREIEIRLTLGLECPFSLQQLPRENKTETKDLHKEGLLSPFPVTNQEA